MVIQFFLYEVQYFTVKPAEKEGIQASSFKEGDKVFINPQSLLPVEMFSEEPKPYFIYLFYY